MTIESGKTYLVTYPGRKGVPVTRKFRAVEIGFDGKWHCNRWVETKQKFTKSTEFVNLSNATAAE